MTQLGYTSLLNRQKVLKYYEHDCGSAVTNKLSTPTMPMTTKFGRVLTYHEGLPSIKSHDPLIMWFCEITQQTISITTMPMATELGWVVNSLEGLLTIKSKKSSIKWSCEITWHIKDIISLPAYGHQAWQGGYNEELSSIKSHDILAMWFCEVTWQIKYATSPLAQHSVTKTWPDDDLNERLPTIMLYKPLNTWKEVRWQI